jgi:signal transduction histidine kinase
VTRLALQGWRPTLLDLLLSLAVVVAGLVESFGRQGPLPGQIDHPAPLAAGAVAAGALLLFRRRFPMTMLLLLTADGYAVRMVTDAGYYAAWHFYSTLILVHTVASAAELRSRRGLGGLVCVLTTYGYLQTFQHNDMAEVLISAIFMGVAYASGILLRRQIDQTMRLTAHTTRLELEREERARWAVTEERNRIARELHDVISHNVSLMTLHTGGVRMLLGDDRARERDLLLGVERAGREAIEELRLMLGMLRGADGNGPESLQPSLDRLNDLVAQVGEAGLEVRLRIVGEPYPLPPGLDQSVYRVIQEALTNVLKHAHAARAEVVIGYDRAELSVEVTDDGTGHPPGGGHGTGHGLIGMRERTAMYGGALVAGPLPGGGYRVSARFSPTGLSAVS